MNQFRIGFLAAFCLACFSAFGQIVDNFSDGNFTQNPVWTGNTADFIVSAAGQLQLNAPAVTGQSALFTSGNMPDSTIWDLDLNLKFDPSGSNQVRIWLQMDQPDVATANGYFLEMGESNAADEIKLFRQDGAVKTELAAGVPALAAIKPNLSIRVKRTAAGFWTVDAAPVGMPLQAQCSVTDATWPGGANRYFGLQCIYTSSNNTGFLLDNVNIRPDVPDTEPPTVLAVQAVDSVTVTVTFSEEMDAASVTTLGNYSVSGGIGSPAAALFSGDKKSVLLTLANGLSTGTYTLQTLGVKDAAGNIAASQNIDFQFIKVEKALVGDVIFTEIMSDPDPSAGLPKVEWLELFNRSNKYIQLGALRLTESTDPLPLPSVVIAPQTWLTLTANSNVPALSAVADRVYGVAGLTTTALNNDGSTLTLSDEAGEIIDAVTYEDDWHTDAVKQAGGWSLERRDDDLACNNFSSWVSCLVAPGGTPSQANSAAGVSVQLADFQDIVMTEIMFNPATGGSEYIELLNRSQRVFNLSDFSVSNGDDVYRIREDRVLKPGDRVVLADNPTDLSNRFQGILASNVVKFALPTLPDDEGLLKIKWNYNCQYILQDSLVYSDDWHNALLSVGDRDGVALERIRADAPTNLPSNWTSASSVVTGAPGTPTLPNSQGFTGNSPSTDDLIGLTRERLSPDDDGYEDYLDIPYQLPGEGYVATLSIYDSEGIPVKNLVRQQLVGTEGALRWDGDSDEGARVRPGIYVLYLEVFNPNGDVQRVKRAVSVLRKF